MTGKTLDPIHEVRPGVFMLRPGYRSVDGEIVYSDAFLDDSPVLALL